MPGSSTAPPSAPRFPASPEQGPQHRQTPAARPSRQGQHGPDRGHRRPSEGAHEDRPGTVPATRARERHEAPAPDAASDVVRWAAFSCVLVPVVLVGYGTSLAGAAGSALGLVAVTGVCRVLLRQSERGAARLLAEQNNGYRGRHGRTAQGTHGRTAPGAHRGTRHSADSAPVD